MGTSFLLGLVFCLQLVADASGAPVSIWCIDYVTGHAQNAAVTVWMDGVFFANLTTDARGFAYVDIPVGAKISVEASSRLHHTTYSPIVTVPQEGLASPLTWVQRLLFSLMMSHLFCGGGDANGG